MVSCHSALNLAAGIALAAVGAAMAVDETAEFRQRYKLDPAKAKANASRVADDLSAAGRKDAKAALYAVPAMGAVKHLADTYPADGALFAPLSWVAAKGEFEPASFVAYALKDYDGVTLKATDLAGKAGKIPASAIDFRVVKLWYQGGSAWYGYFADATQRTLVPEQIGRAHV